MRARILPLDDLAWPIGVAVLLTLSAAEAKDIMDAMTADPETYDSLGQTGKKLYELLQIVAEPDVYRRRMAQDIMNTEGRKRVEEGSPHASQRSVDPWPN